ncbi:protein of unknown function [Nitrosotalea devaniterrae]|uniref:Transposase n=1 Tax=Nitrosotalea devaniterrae TaxID=1078905 RepID=A0A128A620_9ARCH|nr:protein of unknown function [Candidatus Nitrosotalea devanaterra]
MKSLIDNRNTRINYSGYFEIFMSKSLSRLCIFHIIVNSKNG